MAWTVMKMNPPGTAQSNYYEFMIDSESDIYNPPTDIKIAPGSVAYDCDPSASFALEHLWMLSHDGVWVEM